LTDSVEKNNFLVERPCDKLASAYLTDSVEKKNFLLDYAHVPQKVPTLQNNNMEDEARMLSEQERAVAVAVQPSVVFPSHLI
jgi:hypothetical protein